jgi:hypothetical protein
MDLHGHISTVRSKERWKVVRPELHGMMTSRRVMWTHVRHATCHLDSFFFPPYVPIRT